MKLLTPISKSLFFFFFLFSLITQHSSLNTLFAQAPKEFNYQAVARNGTAVLNNATVDVKFEILQGSAQGTSVWNETHTNVTTNALGLFSVKVGSVTTFTVDWAAGPYFLNVQLDLQDGSGYRDFGNAELLSVPFALFAQEGNQGPQGEEGPAGPAGTGLNNQGDWSSGMTVNEGDYVFDDHSAIDPTASMWIFQGTPPYISTLHPYADAANWIEFQAPAGPEASDDQQLSLIGLNLSLERGGSVSLDVEDADPDPANEIQDLVLSGDELTLSMDPTPVSIDLSSYSDNPWTLNGPTNDTLLFPGSVAIGSGMPNGSKLAVQGDNIADEKALFEVKRQDGQTVFAVYNSGVRMYVEEGEEAKSRKGGFAIGGFTPGKGETGKYFLVSPDSVRIYLDTTTAKRRKGGFAIGGYTPGKGINQEYLRVTEDSVRIYLDDTETKRRRGGFAIGGFTPGKDGSEEGDHYFNVSTQNEAYIINPSQPRVLWYPKKEAFLTGRVLIESFDSVGQNSMATGYESKSIGANSQALGYKARTKGDNSTAIGNNANAEGNESYAIGNFAKTTKEGAYAIGSGASATGLRSFALGSTGVDSAGIATSPTIASGDYSYAFGMGSLASAQGAFAFGTQNISSGFYSLAMGYNTEASSYYSTAMGYGTKASSYYSTAMGDGTAASGFVSTAIGYQTTASGFASTAIGYQTTASGWGSIAMGILATANGQYSFAMGENSTASGWRSTTMGYYSTASGSNSTAIGANSIASGNYSTAMGQNTTASEYVSTAMGDGTTATGDRSTAMGNYTIASGSYSTAMGYHTKASGFSSSAFGNSTTASGSVSTAMGATAIARGDLTTAIGRYTTARSYNSFVIGRYNDTIATSNPTQWLETDPLFIIGNGDDDSHRNNAVTVLKNGNVGIGTMSPAQLLDVTGNIRLSGGIRQIEVSEGFLDIRPHDATYGLILRDHTGNSTIWSGFKTVDAATDYLHITMSSSLTSEGLMISDNGNVGVGTTTPAQKLDVAGNIELNGYLVGAFGTIAQSTDEWLRLNPSNSHSSGIYISGNLRADGGLYLGDDERFYRAAEDVIQTTSDLKISGGDIQLFYGTKAIGIRQDGAHSYISNRQNFVNNGSTTNGRLILNGEGGIILKYGLGTSSGIDGLILTETGRVGIGTISPGTKFAIAGLTGTTSGSYLRIYNNNVYYYSSSRETKDEIQPLSEDFSKILKAQPVSFTDKASGERNIGYIAEDFDEIGLEKLVVYENGKAKSLSYELVSLYNLEIIKKQQETIEILQEEINKLKSEKSELALLKEQIAELRESMGLVGSMKDD